MGLDQDILIEDKTIQSRKISSISAISTAINVLLGAGPILVPPVFFEPGLVLTFLFFAFIAFISFISAEFIVETMSLLTAINYREKNGGYEEELSNKLITNHATVLPSNYNSISDNYSQHLIETAPEFDQEQFNIKEPIEYGQMGLQVYGKFGEGFVTIGLVCYLIGVLSSKTIMIGSILSKTFAGITLLQERQVWIVSFFVLSVLFSFSDVQKTKKLQNFIVVVRILTILSLFAGCFQVSANTEFHNLNENHTYFDFKNFANLFSDLQFSLLMHHAIPSMFSSVQKQQDLKKISLAAFGSGSLIIILLCLAGGMAFGRCLDAEYHAGNPYCSGFATGSSYFNDYFRGIGNADWVFYISSFYIFLNVAAFPVLIITCRNNLMGFIAKNKIPSVRHNITKWTVLYTLVIAAPIIIIALSVQNIQIVLDWISGIFGSMIISLFPSSFIILTRIRAERLGINNSQNMHKSYFGNKYLPYGIFVIGLTLFIYTLYNNIRYYV